jgi:hypothetical protein
VKRFACASAVFFGTCLIAFALCFWVQPWGAVVTFHRRMNFERLRWVSVAPLIDAHYPNRPAPFVKPEQYSDRWTAWLVVPKSTNYTFTVSNDDGVRLYLDRRRVIDNWRAQGFGADSRSTNVWLSAGRHALTLTHFNDTGPARLRLEWSGGPIAPHTIVGGRHLLKRLPKAREGVE